MRRTEIGLLKIWKIYPRGTLKPCQTPIWKYGRRRQKVDLQVSDTLSRLPVKTWLYASMDESFHFFLPKFRAKFRVDKGPCLVNLEGHLSLVAANGVDKGRFDIWVLQDSKSLFGFYMPIFNIELTM